MSNPIYEFLRDAKGVVHVGASTGQERELYASLNLPVVWIEAIPSVFEELKENIKQFENQTALNYLITDKNEPNQVKFNITNNSWSSSIYPLGKHKEIWPDVEYVDSLFLHQYTLETALMVEGVDLSQYDTLILDVQGAELKVLEGAKSILPHFKYIRAEATDAEIYEGQCLDHQLDRFLLQHGFKRKQTWSMLESTPEIGLYEILYQSNITVKNCQITDPLTGKDVMLKIGVLESRPRLGFQVHFSVLHNAFGSSGFPLSLVGGAFWEQSMQNGLNNLIRLGCDYVITIDYDSIFMPSDVSELILMAVRYDEADAIASWQVKRHKGGPQVLIGWKGEDGNFDTRIPVEKIIDKEVTEVDTTVFGLTLIKVASLKKVPKPWFQSFPNEDGEWEEGKIDADGYFWRKWKEFGNTIYCANNVKIGHLDEVILWIDDNLQPIRQSVQSFYEQGRPF